MTTIPDHVGREAVRLLNEIAGDGNFIWPRDSDEAAVITVAKLLMNPPAPMTDPDEEAAKRVLTAAGRKYNHLHIIAATKQIRKEREAWEAGR
mgnify:FL=1